ncbi:MAG: UPF0262 family protein [Hyphomicrobium sp.]|jgi:uncharacterized protein (UPF0262 family)|uniref:UPF0262 family protein n=1 Tax=Hyphomicrobium sp. TaxID=82 RepID=UPI0025BA2DCA|nr:UPF0262 family protein [Hyphomicrobium sp.]MBX9863412.1 UPF0262 family protein [Hyphomicrobium sp.]
MIEASSEPVATTHRLSEVLLDPASIGRGNANIEHEREVAIYDLLDENSFELEGREDGPYKLTIGIVDDRLALSVYAASGSQDEPLVTHLLSMTPFKRIMKDYFLVLDSYYQAIRTAQPSRIQAIDVGRRGLHDEGSRVLIERLDGKITLDFDTARRLFTLISALHWKG